MKAFRFRLEKVLAWRRTELEVEQFKTRQLAAQLEEIERARARLAADRTAAEQGVLGASAVDGTELAAFAGYLTRLKRQEIDLERRRLAQDKLLAEQHGKLMEARRRCRLLERLKTRRQDEWQTEMNRELEAFAAEAHLSRWSAGRS